MTARGKDSKRSRGRGQPPKAPGPRQGGTSGPGGVPRPARRARGARVRLIVVAAVVALAAVAGWVALRGRKASTIDRRGDLSIPTAALFESLKVAEKTRDWGRARDLASQMVEREPYNAPLLLVLANEWSNLAWNGANFERTRQPVRTSLERVRIFNFAFALLDSAGKLSNDPREQVMIGRTRGQLYELVGLPIDALTLYLSALRNAPNDTDTQSRRAWVTNHLLDPLITDEEWLRRKKAFEDAARRPR